MEITKNLVLVTTSSAILEETSQILPIDGFSFVDVMFRVKAASGSSVSQASQILQWSNDLDNWETLGTANVISTPYPNKKPNIGTARVPGKYFRLKYSVTFLGAASCSLAADIALRTE